MQLLILSYSDVTELSIDFLTMVILCESDWIETLQVYFFCVIMTKISKEDLLCTIC